ncbi:MAG: alpha/beta hydrolase [Alphaproteobacteria bacterium]|nr:alpha/beta hydrolase [Alphaproteobacteria bacterium]
MKQRWLPVLGTQGFRKMAYTEWGEGAPGKRTLICVHGLTRNGRDFDVLAEALSDRFRVICPDVAGRGQSDWLADASLYDFPLYLSDLAALIARLDVEEVDWLGTSMGGLIGLFMAVQANTPIRRLILNDVGPKLEGSALARIASYVGYRPLFADVASAEAHFRQVHAPFGSLTDQQWRHLAESSLRPVPGGFEFHYDPKIAARFKDAPAGDVDLWPVWQMVTCPVLAIRGEASDLLDAQTLERMKASKPDGRCQIHEIPGCGHAPALMDAAQIGLIRDWLLSA